MALTEIQKDVMASIAKNRSDTSYVAGGVVLNMDWPRMSDDIDIFHDTDEEIGATADIDINQLRTDGFKVSIDVDIYGCVEATVERDEARTLIQWMSETRTRFFPLVRDSEWGARLHPADLAVNKVIAASTRTKARDYVDLLMIENNMGPLGAIIMAASGKPPNFSPLRIVEAIRHKALSVTTEDYISVRGLPPEWTVELIRDGIIGALDRAEAYILKAPFDLVGILAADHNGNPVEISDVNTDGVVYRKATSEPEITPDLPEAGRQWNAKP